MEGQRETGRTRAQQRETHRITILDINISTESSIMSIFSDTRLIALALCSASEMPFASISTVDIVGCCREGREQVWELLSGRKIEGREQVWECGLGGVELWREGRLEGKGASAGWERKQSHETTLGLLVSSPPSPHSLLFPHSIYSARVHRDRPTSFDECSEHEAHLLALAFRPVQLRAMRGSPDGGRGTYT